MFLDKFGYSTKVRKDKTGKKRVITKIGFCVTNAAISSGLRYTTMGFSAGSNGEHVMCCVIMTRESKKGIPTCWITGRDIMKIDETFVYTEAETEMVIKLGQLRVVHQSANFEE